jgi:hypothetical protein
MLEHCEVTRLFAFACVGLPSFWPRALAAASACFVRSEMFRRSFLAEFWTENRPLQASIRARRPFLSG